MTIKSDSNNYTLSWYEDNKSVILTLHQDLNPENANEINDQIIEIAGQYAHPITLIVDATEMTTIINFGAVRDKFTHHTQYNLLKNIFIITTKKILKLSFLVVYGLSVVNIQFIKNINEIKRYKYY